MEKRIALLGSTGSIGVQALEVIREHRDKFSVTVLTSNNNWELLARQAAEFRPAEVVIANPVHLHKLESALSGLGIKIYSGNCSVDMIAGQCQADIVVNALVGYAGLLPTVNALMSDKTVALANKESLVAGGRLVMGLVREHSAGLIPIDSEHSAILQCMCGETAKVEKLILTASGGPFYDMDAADMAKVTPAQALKHPNWEMGAKITIDSATMMNKGFEVIEASWLFGLPAEQIEVVVHPQSIVHSMVEFADGAIKAQLGLPDMKIPIQYALTYPERFHMPGPRFSFADNPLLSFRMPDREKFPCLDIAYEVLRRDGNSGCAINAANECAVETFLNGMIPFTVIPEIIETVLNTVTFIEEPSLDDIIETDKNARVMAHELIASF